jgi:predicted MFS family arabinose efflux permease
LRDRLAPVRDTRVALTLLTSLFAFGGFLMVYTYAGLVLRPVTGGDGRMLAGLLLVWGIASTVGNLLSGRLVDRFDSRRLLNIGLGVGIANFCLLPWTATGPLGAAAALIVWGLCGWGLLVPQQHRLVKIAPQVAPLLLALNNTATYGGLACSGVLGGLVLLSVDGRYLPLVGAGLIALAWGCAEAAHAFIRRGGPAPLPAVEATARAA